MILPDELIVDNFAGGGGASTGIEQALGRSVDIAINHDPEALSMHAANHPNTLHLCENVWDVDIKAVIAGRRIGLAWFSPDCKHFSKAKGGKPVEKHIRGLAWVALRWAGLVKPRVIILENVEEFQTWGPIVKGRPCPRRKGMTFRRWCTQLRNLGYVVEWRELRACDYGAPTIRKRLFVVARRDGRPIVWPSPTHGPGLRPYRTAAECIDWTIPCPSIFLTREEGRAIGAIRPLAEATLRRIARGIKRYVLDAADPFIVPLTHTGSDRTESVRDPLRTTTTARRGERALVVPTLAFVSSYYGDKRASDVRGCAVDEPIPTQPTENRHALVSAFLSRQFGNSIGHSADSPSGTATSGGGGKSAVVAAFLAQHNAGPNNGKMAGRAATSPISTITATGTQQQIVTSHLVKMRGTNVGSAADEPIHTVSAGGTHIGEVRAFLIKYFGTDQDPRIDEPMHTVTSKDRFGLVTVHGEEYVIADIGMRMLTPRELFRAQGFPDSYVIDRGVKITAAGQSGNLFDFPVLLTKTSQVRMCGNSVSPHPAAALVDAQFCAAGEERVA